MNLLIVESPAKAKTINKYLGSSYKVLASFGHVRDLPAKDGSVDPDNDFAMQWSQDDERSKKVVREIAEAAKSADKLILATDPDREGEAISWHLLEVLKARKAIKKGMPVERVTFNAITKQSVQEALKNPRAIDDPLVSAYLARRALDYLVGFTLSPVLWRKLPGARSAGRVQSVALRLICEREAEIEAFKTDEYWTIDALLETAKKEEFTARLTAIAGQKLEKLSLKEEGTAAAIKTAIEKGDFRVVSVDKKPVKRNPYPPFMTSTLQMDASRKLGFSAKQTMGVAQRLYEGVDVGGETVGLITYMRTDGVDITPEGVAAIRRVVQEDYSNRYLPPFIREYKSKAKNAQEAHEAIRPTDPARRPQDIKRYLEKDQFALYELIWKRAVASQMASAEMEQTTADIEVKGRDGKTYGLRASGTIVNFEGFQKVYNEGRDNRVMTIEKGKEDKLADSDEDDRRLPPLAAGDRVTDKQVDAEQHFTQPPPRYSEASLVKRLEELGIGRPSTFASTIATLQDREYVRLDKKRFIPEDKGRIVTAFLVSFFRRYVEYDYTADLEEQLDLISDAKLDWREMLRRFWKDFSRSVDETKELQVRNVLDALNEILGPHLFPDKGDGSDPRACPKCGNGQLSLKPSRQSGAFVGCSNYPECRYSRPLSGNGDGDAAAALDGKVLGQDPETGLDVLLKNGRFGAYVQLGEPTGKDDKPKRSSIPKGWDVATLDLERALLLLRLPRAVGEHPETKTAIVANFGRYGPYILHDGTYVNLASTEEVFEIGVNRAVTLLAEKRAGGGKGRFQRGVAVRKVILDMGEHPDGGGKIEVLEGRYGPYVAHNGVNATVPRGRDPKTLTVSEAVGLLAERIAKGGGKPAKKGGRFAKKAKADGDVGDKKSAAKATKSAPAKKAAGKKAAPKPADGEPPF